MGIIAERMPLVADQAGVWDGRYIHLDADGTEIDRHRSRLVCRLDDGADGVATLSQSNIYDWADGSREVRFFAGVFRGDRLWLVNDLIDGWTASVDDIDPVRRTILVGWTRPQEPGLRFHEMITVTLDGMAKNRVWHWYRDDRLFQRTIVDETRTSRDWRPFDSAELFVTRLRGAA